jgi:histidinol dehydrogenase
MTMRIIQTDHPLADPAVRKLRDRLRGGVTTGPGEIDIPQAVRQVIEDVRRRGDQAVIDLTARIEETELTPETLRVEADRLAEAHMAAEPELLELVRRTVANIGEYQQHIRWPDPPVLRRGGRELGCRYTPVDRACLFVPGGGGTGAVLLSSMLMTVVPAQVAGVPGVALVSPPTAGGDVSPAILAVAHELHIEEVYRVSGTAGLAAVAMGTERMPKVDIIAGPGNAFIAEAKRQLFGIVGIDSLAGPSEVLIVADQSARPDWLAADLLAQAEHTPGSAVLVTPSRELAEAAAAEVDRQLPELARSAGTRECLETYSGIVVVPNLDAACEVAGDFAAEHLQIITADDDGCLAKIRHAGAVFLGPYTPVPVGDYYAGPSHVLPTGGTARFSGPLSCNTFLKASSTERYDAASLAEDAGDIVDFARREGLTAHAAAVTRRTEQT